MRANPNPPEARGPGAPQLVTNPIKSDHRLTRQRSVIKCFRPRSRAHWRKMMLQCSNHFSTNSKKIRPNDLFLDAACGCTAQPHGGNILRYFRRNRSPTLRKIFSVQHLLLRRKTIGGAAAARICTTPCDVPRNTFSLPQVKALAVSVVPFARQANSPQARVTDSPGVLAAISEALMSAAAQAFLAFHRQSNNADERNNFWKPFHKFDSENNERSTSKE